MGGQVLDRRLNSRNNINNQVKVLRWAIRREEDPTVIHSILIRGDNSIGSSCLLMRVSDRISVRNYSLLAAVSSLHTLVLFFFSCPGSSHLRLSSCTSNFIHSYLHYAYDLQKLDCIWHIYSTIIMYIRTSSRLHEIRVFQET